MTLGATREYLDSVRYLSNASSGKMGLALAEALKARGARVTLIAGPGVHKPQGYKFIPVVSALDMLREARKGFPKCDAFVSVAAVSDYRPALRRGRKLEKRRRLRLDLIANPDVIAEMGRRKKRQVVVGFSLEDSAANIARALRKMQAKRCDLMVLNSVRSMDSDLIKAKLIFSRHDVRNLGTISKKVCATKICQAISEKLQAGN